MSTLVKVTKTDGTEIVTDLSTAQTMREANELQTEARDGTELSQTDIMGSDYEGETTLSG